MSDTPTPPPQEEAGTNSEQRRSFLARASTIVMTGGLLAGYGTLGVLAGRFLYPSRPRPMAWLFVARAEDLKRDAALLYVGPAGQPITVTRQGDGGTADDFLALSTTCPHLGCRVHWEAHNQRFFCPCHNGVFAPDGRPTAGPPAEAGQALPRYALKVDNGLLFIEVPVSSL